jgi:hypothetical protein
MEHLSEERIAEIREDGMLLSDFRIGMEFWMSGARWRCTDIGTRLVIAIKLDHDDDPSWYDGPPYAVCEHTIDRHDFTACSLTRYDGNSESYTDEEVERIRNSGMANIVEYRPKILPDVLDRIQASRAHAARKGKEQLPPMTPEQLEAEAAYATKIYEELSNPTPETRRRISEAIKLKRRSKAASLFTKSPAAVAVDAAEHDAAFCAAVQEALDDHRPLVPHAEVEAHFAKRRSDALTREQQT